MYLEFWAPLAVKSQTWPGKFLELKARVTCPFCKESTVIRTGGHSISTSDKDNLIQWKTDEVLKPRACSNCGIVSTLPEIDRKRFLEEVRSTITAEWLEKHKD